jgi:hypothetical protein
MASREEVPTRELEVAVVLAQYKVITLVVMVEQVVAL